MDSADICKPSCEQIINIMPDPFVVIDRNYRIIAANRAYRDRYVSNDEEVVGKQCYEVSHHVDSPCHHHGEHCPLDTVFNKGEAVQVMHVHFDRENQAEYVQIHANPLFDDAGKVVYMGEFINAIHQPDEEGQLLVGRSPAIRRMTSLLQRVASTQTTVLLLGESGVGKERMAQYVHQYSKREGGPFVIVDCASLGESLIESELFGYEKGAFTGATTRKTGLIEAANGGTLFIDEIGEMPLAAQTKLLRVLEGGTIRRIGGTEYIKVDVRILAATHRNLGDMVKSREFRQDLYYRLSAFPVEVPPLRERKDDIPALAEHFLKQIEDGDRHIPLSPEVIEALLYFDYPGNVRELRNIVERASILSIDDTLRVEHLVFENGADERGTMRQSDALSSSSRLLVRRHGGLSENQVLAALQRHNGHRAQAAWDLGVSERTLYRYVKRMRDESSVY